MSAYADVTDVETLRALLSAQQQQLSLQQLQLQQLQGQQQQQKQQAGATAGARKRKAKAATAHDSDSEGDAALGKDDHLWDPDNDSDCTDDAPRSKKKSKSTTKSKKQSKKQQRRNYSDDSASDSDADDVPAKPVQQEKAAKAAAVALRSVKSAINQQMVYKPSVKRGGSSRVSLELPCLTEAVVVAMLGPQLMAKASNSKKQLQLKADNQDLGALYGTGYYSPFCKSLRYGATLELVNGLTFTFNKTTNILKVHGSFTMNK